MPVQMIELEEVQMIEVSDEALEAMKAEVVGAFSYTMIQYNKRYCG